MSKRFAAPIDDEGCREIIADLLACAEYAHSKTKKLDIEGGEPCECLGRLPLAPCQALVMLKYFKFLCGEISIEDLPMLGRLL